MSDNKMISIHLQPDSSAPAMARSAIAGIPATIPDDRLSDLLLLVSEVANYALRRDHDRDGMLEMRVIISARGLRVELENKGKRFGAWSVDQLASSAGIGPRVIETLADRHGFHNVVWVEMDLA